jgi:polar amino acid transport system substrate-binding protein
VHQSSNSVISIFFRKNSSLARYFFAVSLLFFSYSCFSEQLTIAFGYNRAPFVIENTDKGIEIDIVTKALELKGYSLSIIHLSNEQLHLRLSNSSILDASSSVRDKYSMLDDMFYSDDYIMYENIAISLKENKFKINNISQLSGLRVIAWKLAWNDLGDEYKKITRELGIKYFEFNDQEDQNRSFWAGLADVIVVDKSIFNYYRTKLLQEYDTSKKITVHNLFKKNTFFKIAFKNKRHRDDFNAGLQELRLSGEYEKIYDNYLKQLKY